jgi:hypothetical protein
MMKTGSLTNQVFDTAKSGEPPIRLTTLLATSGEGSVYRTDRAGYVAKIYKEPKSSHFRKLEVMIANPPKDPAAPAVSIAWPTAIIATRNGPPAGFLMPEIVNAKRPTILYVPKTRLLDASGVDWFYLHSAALNVARLFKAIHELGCVIGDVKPENLLVNASMQICAIDTDSFQITDSKSKTVYRCPVGTADFTPPELMGKDFATVERRPAHDLFGLSALIYLFLFGKHPYSGGILPDDLVGLETADRIRRGLWQWSRATPLKPHRGTIPLDIVHSEIASLFRRCFDRGGQRPEMRPTAKEWERVLEIAIDDLVWCGDGQHHVYASHRSCPWCEMAKGGLDYFPTKPGLASSSFGYLAQRLNRHVADGDIVKAAALIERHPRLKADPRSAKACAATQKQAAALGRLTKLRSELERAAAKDDYAAIAVVKKAKSAVLALAEKDPQLTALIRRLRALELALDDIEAAIARSVPTNGLFSIHAETEIVDAVRRRFDVLRTSPSTFPRFAERIREAKDRVDAMAALEAAEASGLPASVVEVVERHRTRLKEIIELAPRHAALEELVRLTNHLAAFVKVASQRSIDPEEVCKAWESFPELATAGASTKPSPALEGRTPLETYRAFVSSRDVLRALAEEIHRHVPAGSVPTEAGLAYCRQAVQKYVAVHGPIPARAPLALRVAALESMDRIITAARQIAGRTEGRDFALAQIWRAREGEIVLEDDLAALVSAAEKRLAGAERFAQLASDPNVDEAALVSCWEETGLESASTIGVTISGVVLTERAALAKSRLEAAELLEGAIGKADKDPFRNSKDEAALVAAWDASPLLPKWRGAVERFGPRVHLARLRLERMSTLANAVAAGDWERIAQAWGNDEVLEDLKEGHPHRELARRAVRTTAVVQAVAGELSSSSVDDTKALNLIAPVVEEGDDAVLHTRWSALGGLSIYELHTKLSTRATFRRHLATCDLRSGHALFTLAQAWEPGFGQVDPSLGSHPALLEALELAKRWSEIRAAAQVGNDAVVARLWTDNRVEAAPDFNEVAALVGAALKRYLDAAPRFAALSLGGVTAHSDGSVLLRFQWKDPNVTHAEAVIGDRAVPEFMRADTVSRHVVTRPEFQANDGVILQSTNRMVFALIFPSFILGETIINASRPITVIESSRRTLRYRLFGGAERRNRQHIELMADRPLQLPPLRLSLDTTGSRGETVARFEPMQLGSDGRIVLPLPDKMGFFKAARSVRLEHEVAYDETWLEIVHPDPAGRRMVVR